MRGVEAISTCNPNLMLGSYCDEAFRESGHFRQAAEASSTFSPTAREKIGRTRKQG